MFLSLYNRDDFQGHGTHCLRVDYVVGQVHYGTMFKSSIVLACSTDAHWM
jgi:hypothetical protein